MVMGQDPGMLATAMTPPLHLSTRMVPVHAIAQGYPTYITSTQTASVPGSTVAPTFITAGPAISASASVPSTPSTPSPLSVYTPSPPSSLCGAGSPPLLPPATCAVVPINRTTYAPAPTYVPAPTYAPAPTNLYTGMPVMPCNPPMTLTYKAPNNISTHYSVTNPPIIQSCQQKVINGSVLQCACTAVGQYTGTIQMCPVPRTVPMPIPKCLPPPVSMPNVIPTNIVSPWKQSL